MDNQERDAAIALGYSQGKTAAKLAGHYRLSIPQVRKILAQKEVTRTDTTRVERSKVIDEDHARLGLRLYNYRYNKKLPPTILAELMGWSVKKLRNIEQGYSVLNMLDLKDMAKCMGMSLLELMRGIE